MDRRQQMRLSLSSQNFSPDIHAHYHMTSRSHIRHSGGGMNRLKFIQRRRSKSMDLTPVIEQPGESCATTPGVVVPDSTRGLLCGPAFSPAITPAGETLRVLSPTTPSAGPLVPTVLLREISLSSDNLPALCLNDCPMAATPLMQLGNRSLGSNIRSPLSTAQHRSDRYTSQDSLSSLHTTSTQSSSGNSGKTDGASISTLESGYSTSSDVTDPESSVPRKQRPGNLPISPLKTHPVTPKTSSASSREQPVHLISKGNRSGQRRGSTSSHGSHSSHHSHVSHASDGSTVTETLC